MGNDYITFAAQEQIELRLRERHPGDSPVRQRFYERIVERLAERTYDAGAFSFIVMELVYESESEREEQAEMLTDCILALTRDRDLAIQTLHAFEEISQ